LAVLWAVSIVENSAIRQGASRDRRMRLLGEEKVTTNLQNWNRLELMCRSLAES